MSLRVPLLDADPTSPFPPTESALREPDGLLAMGGDLSPTRLLNAYAHGIFPWFSQGQPILWWSPDPRALFRSDGVHLAARTRRRFRRADWRIVADQEFDAVIHACAAAPRPGQDGTWITRAMRAAYSDLHRLGHAHSIEVRDGERLVGGLYGVSIGRIFFGESMFSAETDGSKAALAGLALRMREWNWPILDAQVGNPHLATLGAEAWPRSRFLAEVARLCAQPGRTGSWAAAFGALPASALG